MSFHSYFNNLLRPVSIAPLVTFRILFGAMMFASTLRFWLKGWIVEQYVKPTFYFTYLGFEWVHPLGNTGMHLLFALLLLSSLLVACGLFYRIAILMFFLVFSYIELIDVTNYLNHYYFISLLSFLLIWLPANRYFSIDTYLFPQLKKTHVPLWTVGILRLQLAIVYFFAGLAKLNYDWMIQALPMKLWLPAKSHLPLVGALMYKTWIAYLFSWIGAIYDLLIAFFLIHRKTRFAAFIFVLGFHISTAIFFPGIGMFPYVMMVSSLIFFSSGFHQKLLAFFSSSKTNTATSATKDEQRSLLKKYIGATSLTVYFLLQLCIPLRFLLYPGNLFWVEEGYRFSWRVMLMEKSGNVFFYVKEPSTGRSFEVDNKIYLTSLQEKMMSTQPDMILRYAHYLRSVYAQKGLTNPAVYAECYVALNGQNSRLFTDTTVNLANQELGWHHYHWVLPYTTYAK